MKEKKPHPLKYCHCHQRMIHGVIAPGPAGTCWEDEFVQYCDRCSLMSHVPQFFLIRRHILMHRAPLGATALLSIRSRPDGMAEIDYATGSGAHGVILSAHPYDRRPEAMGINPNDILLETWKKLDNEVTRIREQDPQLNEDAKHKGRALAEVLALMMPPFFSDADAIVREALRRYDHRGNAEYETPGLGVESLKIFDNMPQPKAPTKSSGKTIPDGAAASSKQGIELGMFTVKQIADSYGMFPEEVKEQLGLA